MIPRVNPPPLLVVPDSRALIDQAFAQGESAGSQTAQLIKLLNQYGPSALSEAIREAIERGTPRASSVAFLLRRQRQPAPQALDLSRYPHVQDLQVRPAPTLGHRPAQFNTSWSIHVQQPYRSPPHRRLPTNVALSLLEMILPSVNPRME